MSAQVELRAPGRTAGIACSHAVPQPGMAKSHYKSDHQRYQSAWHAALCQIEDCEWCQILCDEGLVISCDGCGRVHHTDWLGWGGAVDGKGRCTVLCPECRQEDQSKLEESPQGSV